jgi:hypothetical protein
MFSSIAVMKVEEDVELVEGIDHLEKKNMIELGI